MRQTTGMRKGSMATITSDEDSAGSPMRKAKKFDCQTKIILVGDRSVGKTSLIERYFLKRFQEQQLMTLGVSRNVKLLNLDGYKVKLELFDTAGAEQF